MSKLFTKRSDGFKAFSTPTQGFKNLAPRLISNTSIVDIINSFPWTLTPPTSLALQETPYIKLTEYYLEEGFINQSFQAYGIRISNIDDFLRVVGSGLYADYDANRLYQGLYDHKESTGFTYKIPYFSQEYLQTNNSWMAKPFLKEIFTLQQDIIGFGGAVGGPAVATAGIGMMSFGAYLQRTPFAGIGTAILAAGNVVSIYGEEAIKQITKQAGGFYRLYNIQQQVGRGLISPIGGIDEEDPALDKPHIWNNTVPRSFNISFPLYNILTHPQGDKWNEQILRNWEFCYLLTYQNLFNKRNLFTGIPPVFYEIDIPGVHYTKAGYINNLRILNAGNIRSMSLPIDGTEQTVNVPDAYVINFTITDFFTPSKNFMSSIGISNKQKLTESVGTLPRPEEEIDPRTGVTQSQSDQTFLPAPGNPVNIPGCWVAREIYGINNYKWIIFRDWLYSSNGPVWLQKIYTKYGRQFAKFISNKSIIKKFIKYLMDTVVNKHL